MTSWITIKTKYFEGEYVVYCLRSKRIYLDMQGVMKTIFIEQIFHKFLCLVYRAS